MLKMNDTLQRLGLKAFKTLTHAADLPLYGIGNGRQMPY